MIFLILLKTIVFHDIIYNKRKCHRRSGIVVRQIILGRTGLSVGASSFGALPIQRLSHKEAAYLVRMAYDKGMNFFDTANGYTDSEEKLGLALSDVRDKVIIATKSGAKDKKTLLSHIENSLKMMKTIPMRF